MISLAFLLVVSMVAIGALVSGGMGGWEGFVTYIFLIILTQLGPTWVIISLFAAIVMLFFGSNDMRYGAVAFLGYIFLSSIVANISFITYYA